MSVLSIVNYEANDDEIVVSIQEQLPFVEDVICYNIKFIRDEDCYAVAVEPVCFTKDFDSVQDGCIDGVVDLPIAILPKAALQMAEKKALDIVEGAVAREVDGREYDSVFLGGGW